MENSTKHVKGLNGLRALAVILVFLSHKAHFEAIDAGKLGVWIFFFISGFLIVGELHRNRAGIEHGTQQGRIVIAVFFVKRALRIFPVYYLLLIALAIAHRLFYQRGVHLGLAWHFAFLSNFWIGVVIGKWPGTVSHFWSLAIEQQFYLVAPFALVLTRASVHLRLCAAIVAICAVLHLVLYASGASQPLIYALSPWNFALLALGGMCGMARDDAQIGAQVAAYARRTSWLAMALAGTGICVSQPLWAPALSSVALGWIDLGLSVSLCGVFLHVVNRQDSSLVSALDTPALDYLGKISYGFYLFHNLIPTKLGEAPALYARLHVPIALQHALPIVLQFQLSFLLAHLSWHLLEKRVLALKKPIEAALRSRVRVGVEPQPY
ncbi:acyltransferase [Trinickia violacea]|uniref:Acyltransferase n=1 Tax=Trinickia violacea TaxID=2571746 RepID=A0A4P8IZ00_9BURK|nr:acyltransferase [Trinickia violacea]QCP52494.1 acyltransferase [Trinickia violacea]